MVMQSSMQALHIARRVCCKNERRTLRGPDQVQYTELEGKPIFSQFMAPNAFKHAGSNLNWL